MNNINWDEATRSGGFVTLPEDKEKTLLITNWRVEERPKDAKFAAGEMEFIADVLEEDGEKVEEITFNTTSTRLKKKLRPILENKLPTEKVKISIMKVGEKFNTQYSVKEIKF